MADKKGHFMKMKKYLLLFGLVATNACFASGNDGINVGLGALQTLASAGVTIAGNSGGAPQSMLQSAATQMQQLANLPTEFVPARDAADTVIRAYGILRRNVDSIMPGWLAGYCWARAEKLKKESIRDDFGSLSSALNNLYIRILAMGDANKALSAANRLLGDDNAALRLQIAEFNRANRFSTAQKAAYIGVLLLGVAAGSGLMGYKDRLIAWLRNKVIGISPVPLYGDQ
jgi:hypothetical protein